jgi:hypothetical protein
MRASFGALAGAALAVSALGCDAVLGIQDHTLGPVVDAAVPGDAAVPVGGDDGGGIVGPDAGTDAAQPPPIADAGADGSDASSCACVTGALTCSGNTPEQCAACAWVPQTACGGTKPVCSNGVCGTFRASGGIRSTAPAPITDAGIYLVSGGFELGTRTCSDAGVCVTGGIVP